MQVGQMKVLLHYGFAQEDPCLEACMKVVKIVKEKKSISCVSMNLC